ncbi:SDR family oxidoreductase [Paracoccus sp. Z118]|uniref:SDR family oxidoreductase n=1 Tax=Paracoccus sp. Z118 TaxID=2851017 RepID=UPI001C2BE5E3|nr:SDR family oxidoreductase [Paracoccus sp. Z118]MBV0893208.1 SDR family oxidoreductase [Paracoccus sp. Z118]
MAQASQRLLVVGATGSIGRPVVIAGLAEGYAVRALVRDARRARLPARVELAVGDLTRAQTLRDVVADVDAVVFTHGSNVRPPGPEAVDYGAVRNVLLALDGQRPRIALMTAISTTDRKGAHDWKRRGERLIRASGLDHTIVRPGWFDYNDADQRRLVMLQGDSRQTGTPRDGVIARDQLALVLVRSLRSDAARGKTFELVAEHGPEQPDYDTVFGPLEADAPGTLDGARDTPNMPLADEPAQVIADLERIRAIFKGPARV